MSLIGPYNVQSGQMMYHIHIHTPLVTKGPSKSEMNPIAASRPVQNGTFTSGDSRFLRCCELRLTTLDVQSVSMRDGEGAHVSFAHEGIVSMVLHINRFHTPIVMMDIHWTPTWGK